MELITEAIPLARLLREALADSFWFDYDYGSSDESWQRYFRAFTHAAAIARGR